MTDRNRVTKVSIEGFRSLKSIQNLELSDLNILIGPNGSGKSNFIGFFQMLRYAMSESLQFFIHKHGSGNSMLFMGAKTTPGLRGKIEIEGGGGINGYEFTMAHAAPDTVMYTHETVTYCEYRGQKPLRHDLNNGGMETSIIKAAHGDTIGIGDNAPRFIRDAMDKQCAYQFHDTSPTAYIRKATDISRNRHLLHDAGNLAAILYNLMMYRDPYYKRITDTVRRIVPGFKGFILEPEKNNPDKIMLRWRGADHDYEFGPHQVSDGSLRFMALATLLLQPEDNLPDMIIIDEPELGMHPEAESLLAAMIQSASVNCQMVVATQSATFLDEFAPDNVIVAEINDGATSLKRQSAEELKVWLENYAMGEIWQKNLIGGLP